MAEANAINSTSAGIVTNTGTGFTSSTVTQHGVLIGGASNAASSLAVAATGTVLSGNTGADPSFTATPSVTSITLSSGTALSNYTEGTWTPTLQGASVAGTTTYTSQNGYYTRIGNMVTVWGKITGSAATGTGNAQIGALPFTIKNLTGYAPQGVLSSQSAAGWIWPTSSTYLVSYGLSNSTTAWIETCGKAGANEFLQMANAAFSFFFTMSYQV